MTTTNIPDVPLPAGAYVQADWHDTGGQYRIVTTDARPVDATDLIVSVSAVQLPDGSIDKDESPLVWVDEQVDGRRCECFNITTAGARQLARALIAAAEQVDGWVHGEGEI